ncbi:MAG: DUF262 domain-containing HNH endonuclease family protein [Gammaproteobacteria bacterium]
MTEQKNSAERRTVREWLSRRFMWRIPVYQRHYSWDAAMSDSGPVQLFWEAVQEQVNARLDGENWPTHYLGAVLVDNKTPQGSSGDIKEFDVVDGQQRLTTIQIALFSLIQTAKDHNCEAKFQKDLEEYIFSNPASSRDRAHRHNQSTTKLNPTNFDRSQFEQILFHAYDKIPEHTASRKHMANQKKSKVTKAFEVFCKQMTNLLDDSNKPKSEVLTALQNALLDGFDLYVIVLDKNDEAQKIFASMNNTAKPLTTFDLIRNDVFYRAAKVGAGEDERLFETDDWQSLENPFWEESSEKRKDGIPHIDAYIARMLVAKLKRGDFGFNRTGVFKTYREFSKLGAHGTVDQEIASAIEYTNIYKHLMTGSSDDSRLKDFNFGAFMFERWSSKDFYPVIFIIVSCDLEKSEKQAMLALLESYVIRRNVCGLSSGHYNHTASGLCKGLGNDVSLDSLHNLLTKEKADTLRFPEDEEVKNACVANKFYNTPFQYYVLEEVNNALYADGDERVLVAKKLTVDHILPQGWETNESWSKLLLGDTPADAVEFRKATINARIHTIGNLTLLGGPKNTRKSNRSFDQVKDMLKKSDLQMNRDLAEKCQWDENEIVARSSQLANFICERWPRKVKFGN